MVESFVAKLTRLRKATQKKTAERKQRAREGKARGKLERIKRRTNIIVTDITQPKGSTIITKKSGQRVFRQIQRIKKQIIIRDTRIPSNAKLITTKEGDKLFRIFQKVREGSKRTVTGKKIGVQLSTTSKVVGGKTQKPIVKTVKPVSLVTGVKDARIASGTFIEPLLRKEVAPKIPRITAEEGIKVFEQRVPLKGTILVTKKKVTLTQREFDKAKKFISKSKKVLLRADRLDKTLTKAENKIQKVISKVPLLKDNNFVQSTVKNYIGGAILYFNPITGIPILGARVSQLIDQARLSGRLAVDRDLRNIINKFEGDPKAFDNIVRQSANQAVRSVGENFDPRTPQGLANLLLVLTPLGFKAIKTVKTPLAKIISSSAKISKPVALKLVNTTIKSIGKLGGVKQFIKTSQYIRQLAKAKRGIRVAQKDLAKLAKQAKKIKKVTVKKLKVIKKEKLSLAKQKELDKLVLADAKQLARKRLTGTEVTRLTNLNKVRALILKKVNNLIKKSDALIKSRKNIKGKFVQKRILNNIKQRAKIKPQIDKLILELENISKKKQFIFRKVTTTKEKKALSSLKNVLNDLKKDQFTKVKLIQKFTKKKLRRKSLKQEAKIRAKKEPILIRLKKKLQKQKKLEDLVKKEFKNVETKQKSFLGEIARTIKNNKKALEAAKKIVIRGKSVKGNKFKIFINKSNRFRRDIIKNVDRLAKFKSEFNKFRSFLKSKRTSPKGKKIISNRINNNIQAINNFISRIKRLLPKKEIKIRASLELKFRRARKGRVRIKKKTLFVRLDISKRRLVNLKQVSNRIRSNIRSIQSTISRKVKTQFSKVRQIFRDEVNIFREGKRVDKFIKDLLKEEKNIKQAINLRRKDFVRATKLKQKRAKLEGLVKEINKLKRDLNTVDDLISLNRQAFGLSSARFVDVNKIINDVIRRANTQRADLFRKLVKKRTGKPNTEATNRVIGQNRPAFVQSPVSNQRLITLVETRNVQPIIDAINPNIFGRGFNVGKAISGIIAIVRPKIRITPAKPSIRVIQPKVKIPSKITPALIKILVPATKITPKIRSVVNEIVEAKSIQEVNSAVAQQPKEVQKIVSDVVRVQRQILKLKQIPKPRRLPKRLLLIPIKRKKKIRLGKGERFAFNLRIKRAGRVRVLDVRLPKNRAVKRLVNVLDHSLARSGEIFIVGKTKMKDISAVSLKGFRLKRSKDPKVLRIVESSKKALDTKRERSQLAKARKLKARRKR